MYRRLEHFRVSPEIATEPTAAYACPTEQEGAPAQQAPGDTEASLPSLPKVPDYSELILPLAHGSVLLRPGTANSAPSIS